MLNKILAFVFAICLALPLSAADWSVGVGKVKITPTEPMWMGGYASRDRPAEGTLTELWAKACVLDDGQGGRTVLITADLTAVDRKMGLAIRGLVARKHGLPLGAIALNVSHTHSGPVVGDALAPQYRLSETEKKKVDRYAEQLPEMILKACDQAMESLAPARVEWGTGDCDFAVNRRENKSEVVPERIAKDQLVGPVDHSVPVLRASDRDGKIRAIVFGYACHATTTRFMEWSGDYPGFAQMHLEKANPGAVAMFWAGCGADQNPLPRRTLELLKKYGKQLADSVQEVVKRPMTQIGGQLVARYEEVPLAFGPAWSVEQVNKMAQSRREKDQNWAKIILARYEKEKDLPTHYPYPVQVWRLGDGPRFVLLGGEVVVDYSLALKGEYGMRDIWVAGYTNDVMNYIPSRRVFLEGGYEGVGGMISYAQFAPWTASVEQTILATVRKLADASPRISEAPASHVANELSVIPFQAEITPPIGQPIGMGFVDYAKSVEHPLLAKGVVLRDQGGTYVLCTLDLMEIHNETYDVLRQIIAKAAGTSERRVALHVLHQHTAPALDETAQKLQLEEDDPRLIASMKYTRMIGSRIAEAIGKGRGSWQTVVSVGTSQARVDRVASNRRILQSDGTIVSRSSSTKDPKLHAAPEGLIDPFLKTVSLIGKEGKPVAQIHYYATHPQSFYRDGRISYDVPGIARERLQKKTGVFQVYFTGCGGDVAFGKYNNGSVEARTEITQRLYAAMEKAAAKVSRSPVTPITWREEMVDLLVRRKPEFLAKHNQAILDDPKASFRQKLKAGFNLAWVQRQQRGELVQLSSLSLGDVTLVHLCGEPFVQYQLAAQKMAPGKFVCVAGYGDCAMSYIGGDQILRDVGGYEQSYAFGGACEKILLSAISRLLGKE